MQQGREVNGTIYTKHLKTPSWYTQNVITPQVDGRFVQYSTTPDRRCAALLCVEISSDESLSCDSIAHHHPTCLHSLFSLPERESVTGDLERHNRGSFWCTVRSIRDIISHVLVSLKTLFELVGYSHAPLQAYLKFARLPRTRTTNGRQRTIYV